MAGLGSLSVNQVVFKVEEIVDMGVERSELLQSLHLSEPEHRPLLPPWSPG